MQDRYAGDVGDFGKFSLLRYLFGDAKRKIGIIWYLFPDESHSDDGRYTEYLEKDVFLRCDKELCNKLSHVVNCNRSVEGLEKEELLPSNTVYFSDRLDFHLKYPSQKREDKNGRMENREKWLEKAISKVSKCDTIFLDPDNGIQTSSCSKINQMRSGKYTYYSEISELAKDKIVTIIYHHLGRKGSHEDQINQRIAELRETIKHNGKIYALRYWPYSPRAYFILTDNSEDKRISLQLKRFMQSSYGVFWDSFCNE